MSTVRQYTSFLRKNVLLLMVGVFLFSGLMWAFEEMGVFRSIVGATYLVVGVILYALIGWSCRTSDPDEYFVAGRRVPPIYNGMAVAADWMSAASFIGMAGGLYVNGFDDLAFIMGWTGGYVLVALLLAPYLRKYGGYTIPDFLGDRYGGNMIRIVSAVIIVMLSFMYLVAQILGVGLIMERITGLSFALGVGLGLGGVLLASLWGGMRAITWTQVAQLVVLLIAYLVPASMLAYKHAGFPVAAFAYGPVLEKLSQRESDLSIDPDEIDARDAMNKKAKESREKLEMMRYNDSDANIIFTVDRWLLEERVRQAVALRQGDDVIEKLQAELDAFPKNTAAYVTYLQGMSVVDARAKMARIHTDQFVNAKGEANDPVKKLNMMALVFCLMLGTAALPHILTRFMTTNSVKASRESAFWSLAFILVLYLTAPALAVLLKYDIYTSLVGSKFESLPFWVDTWSRLNLINVFDFNKDGILQLAEFQIKVNDIVVIASAEIAGLPFFVTGMLAMGGFAAAMSTADGLLMTMSSAFVHDMYSKSSGKEMSEKTKTLMMKGALVVVAVLAAVASWFVFESNQRGNILFLVSAAFSLAAAGLFPALVLGIFWKKTTNIAAVLGMLSGFSLTLYYMARTHPLFTNLGIPKMNLWYGIEPIGSGVFGFALGLALIIVVSLLTPRPKQEVQQMVDYLRYPAKKLD